MKFPKRPVSLAVSAAALLCASAPADAASLWSMLSGTPDQGTQAAPIAAKKAKTKTATNAQSVPYLDGTYPGRAYDAYYGLVQVQANISGGQLVSIDVLQWPKSRNTSRYINGSAIPVLEREVISAQNTRVDLVSGATLTSEAFLRSLNSALQQASN